MRSKKAQVKTKNINLALQGGGSHGAFTWGVLDYLLEDGRLSFEAMSATSAGSMNAAAFTYGQSIGGHAGARAKLEELWTRISNAGQIYSPIKSNPWDHFWASSSVLTNIESASSYMAFDAITRTFSPYQTNPFNFNPLKSILEDIIDFDHLQKCQKSTRLFLSATNVKTGKIKIFKNPEITADSVMASACLPFIFQAVEIDGEHYWDGGYMGNPAIYPLIYNPKCNEVLIVHVNPIERDDVPETAPEIFNRINEISFNSSLMREMRAIAFVSKLIDEGKLEDNGRYNQMHVHAISNDEVMRELGIASKFNPDWDFITALKENGRQSAKAWLAQNFDKIGKESSVDIGARYL